MLFGSRNVAPGKGGLSHAFTGSALLQTAVVYDYPHDRCHVLSPGLFHDDFPVYGRSAHHGRPASLCIPGRAATVVTLRRDGSLWLDDAPVDKETLLASAREQQQKDSRFNVVVRADKGMDYGDVMALLDDFKRVGVVQLGLAAESGAEP